MKSATFPNSQGFKYLDKHGRENSLRNRPLASQTGRPHGTPAIPGVLQALGGQGDAGI